MIDFAFNESMNYFRPNEHMARIRLFRACLMALMAVSFRYSC